MTFIPGDTQSKRQHFDSLNYLARDVSAPCHSTNVTYQVTIISHLPSTHENIYCSHHDVISYFHKNTLI
jgi:hypothetical protein